MTTVEELTPLGPCPTCGQRRWHVADCKCQHSVLVHQLGSRNGQVVRTGCTNHSCGCTKFTGVTP